MNQIRSLTCTNPRCCFINKIYKEVNSTVDFGAETAHMLAHGLHILHDPPVGCHSIVWNDARGASFPRHVPSAVV